MPVWPIQQPFDKKYSGRVKRLLGMVCRMSDPQGRVALMLCESLFHLLVEEGVITKAKAMEAIEGVAGFDARDGGGREPIDREQHRDRPHRSDREELCIEGQPVARRRVGWDGSIWPVALATCGVI